MKQKTYESQKKKSDIYLDELMEIVRTELKMADVRVATKHEDMKQNTDLVVTDHNGRTYGVACRTRSSEPYYEKYPNEITLRANTRFGNKTELQKIEEGLGDYMIYAFVEGSKVIAYTIIDLQELRTWLKDPPKGAIIKKINNGAQYRKDPRTQTGFEVLRDVHKYGFILVRACRKQNSLNSFVEVIP